jgi:hypothetical protein
MVNPEVQKNLAWVDSSGTRNEPLELRKKAANQGAEYD